MDLKENNKIEERKTIIFNFLKKNKNWAFVLLLLIIIYLAVDIRVQNLHLLKDQTTNDYIPADLDAMLFDRYAKMIDKEGSLPERDFKRSYPLGVDMSFIDTGVAYFSFYLYKIANFLNPEITIGFTHSVLYPTIATSIGLIFFFLLLRLIFGNLTAILSTAFLAVIPSYLSRTVSGFSDKEPLGMMLIFSVFYFYIKSFKSEKNYLTVVFGLAAGILTGLLSLSWGGVIFLLAIIPFTYLINLLLKGYNKKDFYSYLLWFIPVFIFVGFLTTKFGGVSVFFKSYVGIIPLGILAVPIVNMILERNNRWKELISRVMPLSFASLLVVVVIGSIFIISFLGFDRFYGEIMGFVSKLSTAMRHRWAVTVAENHQPSFLDWGGNLLSLNYLVASLIGAVLLFFNMFKHIKNLKYKALIVFVVFLLAFTLANYSDSSVFNGETNISKLVYFGGIIFFIASSLYLYIRTYRKDYLAFKEFSSIDKGFILAMVWFLAMIVAGKTSVRFIFTLVPPITIMSSYLISEIYKKIKKFKYIPNDNVKLGVAITFILLVLFLPILNGSFVFFTNSAYGMARGVGPIYNVQWQNAMKWVRENTQEDAVFAHWWDYGYLVQDGADRATITDGGNIIIYWNYLLGRHVLLAQNETEALEFLYAHNATHLLIVFEEVGKFPAYSSIGSDENYDRYSVLGSFYLDQSMSKETREGSLLVYKGQSMIDQDFIINGKLIPEQQAFIIGFIIEIKNTVNNETTTATFTQPKAVVYYQGKQFEVPVNCIFLQDKFEKYPKTPDSFDGCIRFLPIIEQTQNGLKSNDIGAFIYLSPKVSRTLFAQLYLLENEKEWKAFKNVYDPSVTPNDYGIWSPFGYFSGSLIGPIKIWEIEYPKDIKFKPEYLETRYSNPELEIARR